MIFDLVAASAAGYFVGGAPTAVLAARLRGRDIFRVGSGNMGAMNTARHLGPALGVLVLMVDVGKGAAAALLGSWMMQVSAATDPFAGGLAASVGAVAGHAWSPYARFRGGKALATVFGTSLPLAPLAGGYALLLLIALTLLLRRTTVAAIATLLAYPFLVGSVLLRSGGASERAFAAATAAGAMAAISIAKHLRAARQAGASRE